MTTWRASDDWYESTCSIEGQEWPPEDHEDYAPTEGYEEWYDSGCTMQYDDYYDEMEREDNPYLEDLPPEE